MWKKANARLSTYVQNADGKRAFESIVKEKMIEKNNRKSTFEEKNKKLSQNVRTKTGLSTLFPSDNNFCEDNNFLMRIIIF